MSIKMSIKTKQGHELILEHWRSQTHSPNLA